MAHIDQLVVCRYGTTLMRCRWPFSRTKCLLLADEVRNAADSNRSGRAPNNITTTTTIYIFGREEQRGALELIRIGWQ